MKFIDLLSVKENTLLKDIGKCMASGYKTYVYGGGTAAKSLINNVGPYGIRIDGKLINREYVCQCEDGICLEDFFDSLHEKVNIVVGFNGFKNQLCNYANKINVLVDNSEIAWSNWELFGGYLTYDKVVEVSPKIQWLYDDVVDELSRKTLIAFINQKLAMKSIYLPEVKSSDRQYFEHDIVKLTNDEVFIDCGAYDGDSAKNFIDELHDRGIESYERIISFEPEGKNYSLLKQRGFSNHLCINRGTSDKIEVVRFSSAGTSSKIDHNGVNSIELDTIDNILAGSRATLIKMDIEGAELAALKGAKQTIQKYKPTLAICIYHKLEDLWEIPKYIHSLVPEYKFYVRAYMDVGIELVLYAVL